MIAVLIPLWGRPDSVKRMIDSWKASHTGKSILIFGMEEDSKVEWPEELYELAAYTIKGKWKNVAEKLQDLYLFARSMQGQSPYLQFDAYMAGADDITFSKGFDHAFLSEINYLDLKCAHRCWVMYGNDTHHGQNLGTHWVCSKEYLEAVGHEFAPIGYMSHSYTDVTHQATCMPLGIYRYLPYVITEHFSWANGKAPRDESFDKVYNDKKVKKDQAEFERWSKEKLPQRIQGLVGAINGSVQRRTAKKG